MDTTEREHSGEVTALTELEREVAEKIWDLLPYDSNCPHCAREVYQESLVPVPTNQNDDPYRAKWRELAQTVIKLVKE